VKGGDKYGREEEKEAREEETRRGRVLVAPRVVHYGGL